MDFQETIEIVHAAWEFCQKPQKSFVPRGERQSGPPSTSSAFGLPWKAWPAEPLAGRGEPETQRQGPSRNNALLGVWPARRRSLQTVVDPVLARLPRPSHIPAPHLAWLHPGVTPALTASSTSEPGFDLTSQDPVSVEVHHCFRSTGYCPHSIPGRWFISTLADLCILTFWLYRAPGPLS